MTVLCRIDPLTAHAMVRYLERFERVDVANLRRLSVQSGFGDNDASVLQFCWHYNHIDLVEVRNRLLTPSVRMALKYGAKSVVVGPMRLMIRDGVVTTCKFTVKDATRRSILRSKQDRRREKSWRNAALMEA